jgi:hypothetical protein
MLGSDFVQMLSEREIDVDHIADFSSRRMTASVT